MKNAITVIIAEDHERFRKDIIDDLCTVGVDTIGEAANGRETLRLFETLIPDVLLLDLNMPVMDGNQTFDVLMQRHPGIRIIILSFHSDDLIINDYMSRGAKGYIPKDMALATVLFDALEEVTKGGTYVLRHQSSSKQERVAYTKKQAELIPLLCSGLTTKEIAEEQRIGLRAVEKRRKSVYAKMGVERAVDFYRQAFAMGLQFLSVQKKNH